MRVSNLVEALEGLAPPALAESWDNVGLLVGRADRPLSGAVMLCIDLTEEVLDEAVEANASAIIAYHPPIFAPLRRLTSIDSRGRMLLRFMEQGVSVYSPHTALDAAPGMLGDWLLERCLSDDASAAASIVRSPLVPALVASPGGSRKIVTFVPASPPETLAQVRGAMAAAGAGVIGNYEQCAFAAPGHGSFLGNERARPAHGSAGVLEVIPELRLEMVAPAHALPAVLAALRAAHPYEEPPIDVHELMPLPDARAGAGRIASLPAPVGPEALARRLSKHLGVDHAQVCGAGRLVTRVAAVPGSGGALLNAAIAAGADAFVTGEMKHHEVLDARERGCAVVLAGHTQTERPFLAELARHVQRALPGLHVLVSAVDRPPLNWI